MESEKEVKVRVAQVAQELYGDSKCGLTAKSGGEWNARAETARGTLAQLKAAVESLMQQSHSNDQLIAEIDREMLNLMLTLQRRAMGEHSETA